MDDPRRGTNFLPIGSSTLYGVELTSSSVCAGRTREHTRTTPSGLGGILTDLARLGTRTSERTVFTCG
jgi:hypothetical protein